METETNHTENPITKIPVEVIPAKTIRKPLKADIQFFDEVKKAMHKNLERHPDHPVTDAEVFSEIVNAYKNNGATQPQQTVNIDETLLANPEIKALFTPEITNVNQLIEDMVVQIDQLNFNLNNLQRSISEMVNPQSLKGSEFICTLSDDLALWARRARSFIYKDGLIQNPDRSQYVIELANMAINEFLNNHYEELKKP